MALIAMTTADHVEYVSDLDNCKKTEKKLLDVPEGADAQYKTEVSILPGATVFKLRSLDVFLMGHIWDSASVLRGVQGSEEVGIHTRVNQTNIDAVRHGLVGLTNFADAKGNAIRFETQKAVVNGRPYDVVADSVMNCLGIVLIQELGREIKRISEVSAAEEKN